MKRKSIFTLMMTCAMFATSFGIKTNVEAIDIPRWSLHVTSALGQTDKNYEFVAADYNNDGIEDMYCINKNGANNHSEIHVLNGSDNYQSFLLQTEINLPKTDYKWTFRVVDYNGDGIKDLVAINRQGDGTFTEIYVLNGADNFQSYLYEGKIGYGQTLSKEQYDFDFADYNKDGKADMYIIKKKADNIYTEVIVLDGNNNFKDRLLTTTTELGKTDANWEFRIGNWNNDETPDLYCINRKGNNATELHVLDGVSEYKRFIEHKITPLGCSDKNFEFTVSHNGNEKQELYVINKNGELKTEIHKMAFISENVEIRQKVVDEALYWEGKIPYHCDSEVQTQILDKNNPPKYMDCADFTSSVYYTVTGEKIGYWTGEQIKVGSEIDIKDLKEKGDCSQLEKGDLIIFNFGEDEVNGEHVGIYIGDGKFIHESGSNMNGGNVKISKLNVGYYKDFVLSVRRVLN